MNKPDILEEILKRIVTEEKDVGIINKRSKGNVFRSDRKQQGRLNKAFYGSKQTGQQWYSKIHDTSD